MSKRSLIEKLCNACRADDLQSFDKHWQNASQCKPAETVDSAELLRAVLSSECIFSALLSPQSVSGHNEMFAHPLLYPLINYALSNAAKYADKITAIAEFGITHNHKLAKKICCNEISQTGELICAGKAVGRAVTYNATQPIDGTAELFKKLDELNAGIKAICAKQSYLAGGYSGLSVKRDGGIIEKERSFNDNEYTLLKLLSESGYTKAPKYLGVRNGKDVFGYINGDTIAYTYEMSARAIMGITNELKAINAVSKRHLGDKVYVHGDLGTQNVIFNGDEIVGIIDWDNTFIGEEYDDFIYVFWVWANVGNLQRDDEKMFDLLKLMVDTYKPDKSFTTGFANKIRQRMIRKLNETPRESNIYKRIHDWVEWSLAWVDKYAARITAEIG